MGVGRTLQTIDAHLSLRTYVIMKSYRIVSIALLLLVLVALPFAFSHAMSITTPYWCGSSWSSMPCSSYNYGNYNNSYVYSYPYQSYPQQYSYQYGYPSYPYNYYSNYNYGYAYPTPSCIITVSSSYANSYYGYGYMYNQPATLSWSANNATSAYISPDVGTVATYGSRTVYPAQNMTYTMTVYGPGGTNTCQTTYYQQYQQYQPYYQYQQYPYQQYPYNQYQYNNYQYQYSYPYYW